MSAASQSGSVLQHPTPVTNAVHTVVIKLIELIVLQDLGGN